MNSSVQVFKNQYLSAKTGSASKITSSAVPVRGNKVVMAITLINITGSPTTVKFRLEGSYDGLAWLETSAEITALTSFGYDDDALASLDYAYVRIYAEIGGGTNPAMLFDATLAFSDQ